jgi:hypothetical protein
MYGNASAAVTDVMKAAAAPGGRVLASIIFPVDTDALQGLARAAVVDGPEPGTGLDFYFQYTNLAGQPLDTLSIPGFPFDAVSTTLQFGAAFDVFAAGQLALVAINRDIAGGVSLDFDAARSGVRQSTYTVVLRTGLTSFRGTTMTLNEGAGSAPALAPELPGQVTSAVPEPVTAPLLAAGLLMLAAGARRLRRPSDPCPGPTSSTASSRAPGR